MMCWTVSRSVWIEKNKNINLIETPSYCIVDLKFNTTYRTSYFTELNIISSIDPDLTSCVQNGSIVSEIILIIVIFDVVNM